MSIVNSLGAPQKLPRQPQDTSNAFRTPFNRPQDTPKTLKWSPSRAEKTQPTVSSSTLYSVVRGCSVLSCPALSYTVLFCPIARRSFGKFWFIHSTTIVSDVDNNRSVVMHTFTHIQSSHRCVTMIRCNALQGSPNASSGRSWHRHIFSPRFFIFLKCPSLTNLAPRRPASVGCL